MYIKYFLYSAKCNCDGQNYMSMLLHSLANSEKNCVCKRTQKICMGMQSFLREHKTLSGGGAGMM